MSAVHVHMHHTPDPEIKRYFEDLLSEGVRVTYGEKGSEGKEYQILVSGRPEREFVKGAEELEALIIPWAGVPDETRQLLEEFPHVSVHNLHHNAAPTAETALALLFAAAKSVLPLDRSLRGHDWRPRYQGGHSLLLAGKTALILGHGEIGRRVGEVLLAAGVAVLATRKHPEAGREGEVALYPPQALHELLPRANMLILTLPLTPETRGMIGARELNLLPEGAILVNVSRGPIIDQAALYQALSEGRLFGAGLDVWYNYPEGEDQRRNTAPADYPFHELDNVVMSPHRGGSTRSTERLRMSHLAALINHAARGEEMPDRVDLSQGY